MRVAAEIPHPLFKITIFTWNAKYIIKIELDQYEQVFKLNESDVPGISFIEKMIDENFLDETLERFKSMRTSFTSAYKKIS